MQLLHQQEFGTPLQKIFLWELSLDHLRDVNIGFWDYIGEKIDWLQICSQCLLETPHWYSLSLLIFKLIWRLFGL
jgi:hypothetical protein